MNQLKIATRKHDTHPVINPHAHNENNGPQLRGANHSDPPVFLYGQKSSQQGPNSKTNLELVGHGRGQANGIRKSKGEHHQLRTRNNNGAFAI